MDIQRLEERLQEEREERGRLELELEKLQRERAVLEEQTEQRGRGFSCRWQNTTLYVFSIPFINLWSMCPVWCNVDFAVMRDKQKHLEQEVLQYREQLSAQQDKLDFVTKVRDEELSRVS